MDSTNTDCEQSSGINNPYHPFLFRIISYQTCLETDRLAGVIDPSVIYVQGRPGTVHTACFISHHSSKCNAELLSHPPTIEWVPRSILQAVKKKKKKKKNVPMRVRRYHDQLCTCTLTTTMCYIPTLWHITLLHHSFDDHSPPPPPDTLHSSKRDAKDSSNGSWSYPLAEKCASRYTYDHGYHSSALFSKGIFIHDKP